MTKFYPRIDGSRQPIEPISINSLILDFVEDEGLLPQYMSKNGVWCEFRYKERTGPRSYVRFQTGEGLERFLTEVRNNWKNVR